MNNYAHQQDKMLLHFKKSQANHVCFACLRQLNAGKIHHIFHTRLTFGDQRMTLQIMYVTQMTHIPKHKAKLLSRQNIHDSLEIS